MRVIVQSRQRANWRNDNSHGYGGSGRPNGSIVKIHVRLNCCSNRSPESSIENDSLWYTTASKEFRRVEYFI